MEDSREVNEMLQKVMEVNDILLRIAPSLRIEGYAAAFNMVDAGLKLYQVYHPMDWSKVGPPKYKISF